MLPDAPDGVERALARLGEVAWSAEEYRLLLDLLARAEAAKVLRHAEAIDAQLVRTLAATPSALLRAGSGRLLLTPAQSSALAEAHAVIERRDGAEAAERAALRWATTGKLDKLFEAVRDDLTVELPPPPFEGTVCLRPLTTKAAIRDAAKRYNNCLASQVGAAADGSCAYYEWLGPPAAVVELNRDRVFGWRLSEVKLRNNATMPQHERGPLLNELNMLGVYVGRNGWSFDWLLQSAARPDFVLPPLSEAVNEAFGD